MSDAVSGAEAPRASFWRETLRQIRTVLRNEWQLLAAASLVMAAIAAPQSWGLEPAAFENSKQYLFDHPDAKLRMNAMIVTRILASLLFNYLFCVAYLQDMVPNNKPAYSVGGFFHWLGQVVLAALVCLIPGLILAAGFLSVLYYLDPQGPVLDLFYALSGLVFIFWYGAVLRFSLVSPIAVLRRAPVLKNSWRLLKDQCLRMILSFLFLLLLLLAVFLLPGILWSASRMILGADAIATQLISYLFHGCFSAATTMLSVVYFCTVYRLRLGEQIAATNGAETANPSL